MTVIGVSHIALGVTDLDRAIAFYCAVIGLEVAADWIQEMGPEMGPELHGGRHIRRRQAWLRANSGENAFSLALDQMYEPKPADHRSDIYDLGTHHFSFWVHDVDAVIARAEAGGHPVILPHYAKTRDYGEDNDGVIRSVFLRDPDGNLVQCDQRVSADSATRILETRRSET